MQAMFGKSLSLCLTQDLPLGTMLCVPRATVITKREAADLLGVTPSAVQRMMERGDLRVTETVHTNGRPVLHLFRLSDVERLCAKRAA